MPNRLLALVVTSILAVSPSALDRAHFMELNKKAHEQSQKKDWKGLRESLIAIGAEMPAPTPVYLLQMASVETHLGQNAEAIGWMKKYAAMGLKYDIAQDEDLKPLLADPAFSAVAEEMKSRTKPVQKAEGVCAIPIPDLMPEDITFDHDGKTFVVTSIQHHTLYRVTLPKPGSAECGVQEITLEDQARRWPALAVSADPPRQLLWMTACALSGFTGFPKEDEGKAALFAIDAATGKVVRRFEVDTKEATVLGDMSVEKDGTVYVSDSEGGGVYRVRGDLATAKLEKIGGDFFSPQTPVLARDGRRLFVPDYAMGIGIVDLDKAGTPGQLNYLPHPESVAVNGLDGLYLQGDALIGIQNGTEPERIVRFHLNPSQTAITSAEVIEQSTSRLGDPTHGTKLNGWLYVTANVGWNKIDDHGKMKAGEHFTAPILLRFR